MNNQITLVGYVGQTPKQKVFADTDNRVVKFPIGVKEYNSKSDEKHTIWFNVDAWNGLGDRVMATMTKGREVVVHGRMVLSTYKKEVNGQVVDWPTACVKLTGFHLCGKKPVAEGEAVESVDEDSSAAELFEGEILD